MLAKTCLVVAAHADDEVLGCGGTMARLAADGAEVHVLFLADGVASRTDTRAAAADDPAYVARRQRAEAAAGILGAASFLFAGFPDNRMDSVDLLDVARVVEASVARYRPELVMTHHPGDLNVDHQIAHRAVMTACRPQPGHPVRTILLFEVPSSSEWQSPIGMAPFVPNWFIDISAHLERRQRALAQYDAELRPWPHPRSHEAVAHLARWRGATVGVEAAEAFVLARTITD